MEMWICAAALMWLAVASHALAGEDPSLGEAVRGNAFTDAFAFKVSMNGGDSSRQSYGGRDNYWNPYEKKRDELVDFIDLTSDVPKDSTKEIEPSVKELGAGNKWGYEDSRRRRRRYGEDRRRRRRYGEDRRRRRRRYGEDRRRRRRESSYYSSPSPPYSYSDSRRRVEHTVGGILGTCSASACGFGYNSGGCSGQPTGSIPMQPCQRVQIADYTTYDGSYQEYTCRGQQQCTTKLELELRDGEVAFYFDLTNNGHFAKRTIACLDQCFEKCNYIFACVSTRRGWRSSTVSRLKRALNCPESAGEGQTCAYSKTGGPYNNGGCAHRRRTSSSC